MMNHSADTYAKCVISYHTFLCVHRFETNKKKQKEESYVTIYMVDYNFYINPALLILSFDHIILLRRHLGYRFQIKYYFKF